MNKKQELTEVIVDFLNSINIKVIEKKLPKNTFLPGISLFKNSILVDLEQLKYPGDLLHEAGHIAVTEKEKRLHIGTQKMDCNWPTEGDEIVTILWSYAACCFLQLDLEVVFHPDGYKGESKWLIEQFKNKTYIGLPLLEWMSLCTETEFPVMRKWLR